MSTETNDYWIGGRLFRDAGMPLIPAHAAYVQERRRATGMDTFQAGRETPDEFGLRIVRDNMESGKRALYELFAAIVLPAELRNEDWTPQVSNENALFFAGLTNPQHVAEFRQEFFDMLAAAVLPGVLQLLSQQRSDEPQPN